MLATQAVPAWAASGETVTVGDTSVACKITAGLSLYEFRLDYVNTGLASTQVCFVSGIMYPNGCDPVAADTTTMSPASGCVTVAPGKTGRIVVDSVPSTCASNGYMIVTYTYTDGAGNVVTATTPVTFNSVKPCK